MARMLTPEEMADRLAVPVATLYRWRYSRQPDGSPGGPPAIRVGKYLRYDPVAVDAWLSKQAQDTRRPA